MNRRTTRTFCCLLLSLLPQIKVVAQDSLTKKLSHVIGVGIGAGGSKYFPGLGGSISYELHTSPKYFFKAAVQGIEEFVLFGGEPQALTNYTVSANRIFSLKNAEITLGTGISITNYKLGFDNFYTPEPGSNVPNQYRLINKRSVGLPINFAAMAKITNVFYLGLGAHADYNKVNSFYGGHLKFDFHLFK